MWFAVRVRLPVAVGSVSFRSCVAFAWVVMSVGSGGTAVFAVAFAFVMGLVGSSVVFGGAVLAKGI